MRPGGHPARRQFPRFCQGTFRPVNTQLRNDFAYAEKEERLPRLVQPSLVPVLLGQGERRYQDLVIQAYQRVSFQKSGRDRSGIFLIQGKQTLIKLGFN